MSEPNPEFVSEIEAVLQHMVDEGLGIESIFAPIRAIGEAAGWDWLVGGKRPQFNARCVLLAREFSYGHLSAERRNQLVDGNFAFWVFRADPDCPQSHLDLDGVAALPDHPLWAAAYPPLDPSCSCYVAGARTASGVRRIGGDIDKPIPDLVPKAAPRSVLQILQGIQQGEPLDG